ncbi:acetyltransferase [Virgibacillus oceani]
MKIILLGDGGHSRVIQEMVYSKAGYDIAAVLDDKYEQGFQLNGMIHAPISFIWRLLRKDTKVVVAIGNNDVRKKTVKELDLPPERFVAIVHPTAVISTTSKIGCGTVIMPYAVVNAKADIGMHCIINSAAIVEHDSEIADYAHISPNATLSGNVSTGEGVHIGSSATVIPGKHIGNWSVVGAGSTVIEHIPAYSKAVGSPTRIIERILIK